MQNNIFEQKFVGNTVGGLLDIYTRTSVVIGVINTVMLAATFYTTNDSNITRYIPFMNIWLFMAGIAVIVGACMLMVYKFLLPSQISFANNQAYQHNNPFRTQLDELDKKQTEMYKEIIWRLKNIEMRDNGKN